MIDHLTQPNDHTCVHTCLSMITGTSVSDFIDRFGDHAIGFDESATVLVEHGLFPQNTTGGPHQFPFSGWYLVACASKNFKARAHQILVYANPDGFIVYDPQKGREGKEFWSGSEILDGLMPITETLYLDPTILRKMENRKSCSLYD